ncbi:MAG: hypothetical protein NXI32_13445 [bacterium]|nr:hypothetical protein [bacterium]
MQTSSERSNAFVLTIEGLGTSLLGAYGANLARTPFFDHLAATGVVLDQCFLDSLDRCEQLRSLWTGRHSQQRGHYGDAGTNPPLTQPPPPVSIWQACQQAGIPHCLITDCERVARLAEQMGCQEPLLVPTEPHHAIATDSSLCDLMQLFTSAADLLAQRNGLVWVHSRGLEHAWDAPSELRQLFADPEDPDPPAEVEPPELWVASETDPDLVMGWAQVAAAQAAVVDEGAACLVAALDARQDAHAWARLVATLGGCSLGEHGFVGLPGRLNDDLELVWKSGMHAESLACGVVIQAAGDAAPRMRRSELFQLPDLASTIAGCMGLDLGRGTDLWGRDILRLAWSDQPSRWLPDFQIAALRQDHLHWLRCPAWSLKLSGTSGTHDIPQIQSPHEWEDHLQCQLYVKPEDRWEINDIASRRPDIVQELLTLMHSFAEAIRLAQRGHWGEIADELRSLLR